MSKILKIDLSDDRLISIAVDMVDNHNYTGALKMLNKNARLHGSDEDALSLYAEIFDDLCLYEKSINGWFAYLDNTLSEDLSDCYEGLAVSYMNLGNEQISAFYYNKLLTGNDAVDPEMREQILNDFFSIDENPLKFAYPPSLADTSHIFSEGIELMKNGDYDKAAQIFEEVDSGNAKYLSARNYIAMCKIISDRTDEAEQECLKILENHPDDIQALTTLSAVKSEAGKRDEAVGLARRLLALDVKDNDEIYKIATVCCENKLHDEAFKLFQKLSATDEFAYDLSVMYFRAVAAFNCGKYETALKVFDDLVTVYPEAVTARYTYNIARQMHKKGEYKELSYFYRLPQELQESSLKILTAISRLSGKSGLKLAEEVDISGLLDWCYEAAETGGDELKLLAAQVAVKAGLDDRVRSILLNAFLSDKLKIGILTALAERNEPDCFGVVICHSYRHVTMPSIAVGRNKRKFFVRAVAKLVAYFSVLSDEHGGRFALSAEELYSKLEEENRLDAAKDTEALMAAIYINSDVRDAEVVGKFIYEFFEVSEERVKNITG